MERKHGSRENIPFNPLYLEIEKEESKNRFLFHFKPTDYSVTACIPNFLRPNSPLYTNISNISRDRIIRSLKGKRGALDRNLCANSKRYAADIRIEDSLNHIPVENELRRGTSRMY